jgi:hypothetical protein
MATGMFQKLPYTLRRLRTARFIPGVYNEANS